MREQRIEDGETTAASNSRVQSRTHSAAVSSSTEHRMALAGRGRAGCPAPPDVRRSPLGGSIRKRELGQGQIDLTRLHHLRTLLELTYELRVQREAFRHHGGSFDQWLPGLRLRLPTVSTSWTSERGRRRRCGCGGAASGIVQG